MKYIRYRELPNSVLVQLESEYSDIFKNDISDVVDNNGNVTKKGLQSRWEDWKNKYDPHNTISESVKDLLLADFEKLADVYERFLKLNYPPEDPKDKRRQNPILSELDDVFHYSNHYDDQIADFFIKNASILKITCCYYCEMSYVNVYSVRDNATKKDLRQFDLDHFLPKSVCPCVGLSLYNLVPSCQVCNSRIKSKNMPSSTIANYKYYSPTSADSDFDNNITIRLRPLPVYDDLLGDHYIHFRTAKPYDEYVKFFHLRERYEFHKSEAIRLNRLKRLYPQSNIIKIANILGYSPAQVQEDIFALRHIRREGRCFEKLTKDILK